MQVNLLPSLLACQRGARHMETPLPHALWSSLYYQVLFSCDALIKAELGTLEATASIRFLWLSSEWAQQSFSLARKINAAQSEVLPAPEKKISSLKTQPCKAHYGCTFVMKWCDLKLERMMLWIMHPAQFLPVGKVETNQMYLLKSVLGDVILTNEE